MIVVADAEALLDQVADHRPGPDARLVASLNRPELDDDRQRRALLLGQLGRRPLGDARSKPVDVIRVVPLQPAIHTAARDAGLRRDLRDGPAIDIGSNGTSSTPLGKVVLELRFYDERVELSDLRGPATRTTNCSSGIGLSHDRPTMIL